MFEILKPDKKAVGKRLRQVKDELNLSFTDFEFLHLLMRIPG